MNFLKMKLLFIPLFQVVDQKKLEKAEARLKSKQEKRDNTDKPVSG